MTKPTTLKQTGTALARADRDATHAVAARRDTLPLRLVGMLAEVGDQPQMIALATGTLAVGLIGRRPDIIRGGARMLAAHLLATGVKTVIKHQVDRRRPAAAEESGEHHFRKGRSHDHEENSFPSGHTAGAAIGWASEALVSAAFDRLEPRIERVLGLVQEGHRQTAGADRHSAHCEAKQAYFEPSSRA